MLLIECDDTALLLIGLDGRFCDEERVLIVIGGVVGGARIGVDKLDLESWRVTVVPLDVAGVPYEEKNKFTLFQSFVYKIWKNQWKVKTQQISNNFDFDCFILHYLLDFCAKRIHKIPTSKWCSVATLLQV